MVTDDELTDLALAADPDGELSGDAVNLWDLLASEHDEIATPRLPEWYMPAPRAGARPPRKRWHRWVAAAVIASFVLINVLGLCITYGQLVAA
jgi:hypothetical protein